MGIWKDIKYALNSTLGTSEFKPLNKLINDNFNRGFVKSVQTGLFNKNIPDEDVKTQDITISNVDINKCIVIIDTFGGVNATTGFLKSNTILTVYRTRFIEAVIDSSEFENIRWQIIEFY